MTDNITGKTILLTFCEFYGFPEKVKDTLLELGAKEVVLKELDGMMNSFRDKFTITKPIRYIMNPNERTKRTQQLIKEIDSYTFDVFLCVTFMRFTKGFLDYLRSKNPNVRIVLFLWDKLSYNQPRYLDFLPKFDKVYNFDKDEAKKLGVEYYPDFYIDEGTEPNKELVYDISFVGKISKNTLNRVFILHAIDSFCKEHNLKSFLYLKEFCYAKPAKSALQKKWRNIKNKNERNIIKRYRQFGFLYTNKIPYKMVDEVYSQSRTILDISHPGRQGMTINAITALAKGKKLITTNKRIKEEPFYDPNVIYILDEDNPQLDLEFFNTPYTPVDMSHLRLDNWLKHILNDV